MEIHRFELPPLGTNAYLLAEPGLAKAVLFDAPPTAVETIAPLLAERGWQLTGLYLTHGHWDHMLEATAVAQAHGCATWAHPGDRPLLENPSRMASYAWPGLRWQAVQPEHWLADGQQLDILGQRVEVRHVPGHSLGSVLFYFAAEGLAIVGDVIFAGAVGRTDLPGGSWGQLEHSIRQRVYSLPDDTVLYPGHGPETTVAEEKAHNPYVSA